MPALRRVLLLLAVSLTPLIAACGDTDEMISSNEGSPTIERLTNREFWSIAVTQQGAPRDLLEGTRIMLRFKERQISASAGCNLIGASFTLDGDTLVAKDVSMTEIGCDFELHAQDELVTALLLQAPIIALAGNHLTLTTNDTSIEFLDQRDANPERTLVGTLWAVTGFFDSETSSSFAIDEDGWFRFDDNSTLVGFDGCSSFAFDVEVSPRFKVELSDGTTKVQIGSLAGSLDPICDTNAEYVKSFRAVFNTGTTVIDIDGDHLMIMASAMFKNIDGCQYRQRVAGIDIDICSGEHGVTARAIE